MSAFAWVMFTWFVLQALLSVLVIVSRVTRPTIDRRGGLVICTVQLCLEIWFACWAWSVA